MNSKVTSVVSYLTWIGLIIAVFCGTRDENSNRHINQALVLCIIGTVSGVLGGALALIPGVRILSAIVFGLLGTVTFICFVIGIVTAATDSDFSIPFVGDIKIIK